MPLSPASFEFVRELVFAQSAIVLERGKEYLVESRLTPLAQRLGHPSLDAMIGQLRADPVNGAHRQVVDAMTTNETSFFRDIHPFETLKKVILPELVMKRAPERALRIWCAACSTGQEPYSIALLLRDTFPQLSTWRVQLLATDLSRDVLEKARQGIYTQFEMNRGLPAVMLIKYFTKVGADTWRVRDDIRAQVEFEEFNLSKPFPTLPCFDLIFLRNVLIYFDTETKKSILGRIRRVLAPTGYFFLGGAETTMNLDDKFESMTLGKTVCYRRKE
jgi:chemotaxis protein methyltransferase CheR